MKKIFLSLIMASALIASSSTINSCSKIEDAIDDISIPVPFSIPLSFQTEITFATVSTTGYIRYPELNTNIDLNEKIKEKYPQFSINNLKSARLDGFNIQFVSSDLGANLDAVRNARVYIKTPNLPERLIATVENNTNGNVITFQPVADVDLIEYLKSTQNSLILEVMGQKTVLDIMTVKINPSFRISVGF